MAKAKDLRFVIAYVVFLALLALSSVVAKTIPVAFNNYEPVFDILPLPVRNAIKESQGIVVVRFSTFSGNEQYEILRAGGTLVIDNNHVLTVGHVAKYPAVATSKSTNIMFNGISAKFIFTQQNADLALLELEYPVINMKPAEVADSAEFGKIYSGIVFYDDFAIALKMELIGVGGPMFYFDKPGQQGMSGVPLWNDDGKVVSIINSTTPAFSRGTRIEVINEFLSRARQYIEEEKKKQDDDKKKNDESLLPSSNLDRIFQFFLTKFF